MTTEKPFRTPVLTDEAARAAFNWAGGIILLSVAVIVLGVALGYLAPTSAPFNGVAFVPILVFAIFASKGKGWARVVLAGLTVVHAVNVVASGALARPGIGSVVVLAYLAGVTICIWGLYRPPASAHFSR